MARYETDELFTLVMGVPVPSLTGNDEQRGAYAAAPDPEGCPDCGASLTDDEIAAAWCDCGWMGDENQED